jgi:hypothetical protein
MSEKEPEAAGAVRGFYSAYWRRVRSNLWGDVAETVVPVLLGRFRHEVNVCADGVLVVMRRSSTDSFEWKERERPTMEVLREVLGDEEACRSLDLDEFAPGQPSDLDFDLDVAAKREEGKRRPYDRIQLRYVPFDRDYAFWTAANAERLAGRNLGGPLE